MESHTRPWLFLVIAWLCVLNADIISSNPSVTLPDWSSSADYVTRCDFDNNLHPFCDWTADHLIRHQALPGNYYLSRDPASASGVTHLKSDVLHLTEDSCLEFWYHKPGRESSELKVLISDEVLQTQIWSSVSAESQAWTQVLIPLDKSHMTGAQVVFEISGQGHEETSVDKIGLRRGQCDTQCRSGTEFLTHDSTQCTCMEGKLFCTPITCSDGENCRQRARPTDPSLSGTCRVAGDLRYTTFDGVSFRFKGPCTYVLTKVCDMPGVLPDFTVEIQNEQRGNSAVYSAQQVNVNLPGLRIILLRSDRRKVLVNGIWRNLPLRLEETGLKISTKGPAMVLQTQFNLSLSFAKSGSLQVSVPGQYSDKLCGMCGNFNSLTDDDNRKPDGSVAENTQVLGQSWKSADHLCAEPTLPSTCSEAEMLEYSNEAYCGALLSFNSPFSECSSSLSAVHFFKSCVLELCSAHGDLNILCSVLEGFTKTCKEAGISVTGWRNATYCSQTCEANSHFNACSSNCPESCSMLDAPEDCGTCEERCECDNGFMLSGGKCVPAEDCGCWVDGHHYEKGETFMEGNCERQCVCTGHNNIRCSANACLSSEVCKVKDGITGCFPSSPVTCSVFGDPHYITFDGKAYSFRGTCNYTIATVCGGSSVPYTLTARNEQRNNSESSSLNSVALLTDGLHLVIRKNKLVFVNGYQTTLPYSHNTAVSVSQVGQYVQVDTNFGLRVLFNGNDRLFMQADERHKGQTCGLCGTYSGSQFDDFLKPDGNIVPYPHEFASSWNTQDKDWICTDGSPNDPPCPPALDSEGFEECSKLFGNAFKACHWFVPPQIFVDSCVFDHCTSEGNTARLCSSLQNYVAACEVAEVFLGEWWQNTVCADLATTPTPIPTTIPITLPTTQTPSTPNQSASCSWICNFDQNECGWEQLIQDSFDWTRWSGSTPSDLTGPSSDHTTGSGFYMYIEGDGVYQGDSARMMSPVCNTVGTQCLSFWYHMYGWYSMAFNVYLLEGSHATKIWSRTNNQGNFWQLAEIEINSQGPFQIIMEGIRGSHYESDAAFDDITIRHGKCRVSVANPDQSEVTPSTEEDLSLVTTGTGEVWSSTGPAIIDAAIFSQPGDSSNHHPVCRIDCNFDNGFCTWTQLLTDVFDWTRHSGSTPTATTGPSSDHTTGSGHYIYIGGDSASHGDTARRLSDDCSDRQPQCLQFWYHMYGSSWTMGLTVYLLHGNKAQEIWRMRDNQGNSWHQALVDFTPQENFKILFEGRRGHSERSDVAIDDVLLHSGPCADLSNDVTILPTSGRLTVSPVVTSMIETPPPPTTVRDVSQPGDSNNNHPVCRIGCSFDNNLCTWTQLVTDVFDWTRHSGSTPTAMTGPSSDHTTGSGHYIYIEGDSASHGDTARLLSDDCSDRQPQCLQFWYHMYGSSWTMGLTVYLLHGNKAQEIWRMRDNQGNSWHQALVDFTPQENFKILFEGRRGHSAQSDVAVDDVSLHRGSCADLMKHVTASFSPEEMTVTTAVAPVQTSHEPVQSNPSPVAIFSHQSGSNSRQSVCRIGCNFDTDLCTWTQLLTDVFDWTRHSGSTPTALTGPSSDHTTGSGHYIYIEGDSASHGDTARLLSDDCSDRQPQCLQFWYHMYGSSWTMGLTVYLLHGNKAQEIWRMRDNQGNSWHQALVDFTPQENFKILFEGRRGHSERSDVAIDDVLLHSGPCADLSNNVTILPTSGRLTVSPIVTSMIEIPPPPTTVRDVSQPGDSNNNHPVCPIGCSFDNNLCTWTQLETDVFDWTRHSGSTPTAKTGPSSDHTTGSGHYIYIEGDSASHGDTARLLSDNCSDRQPQCLQFWYHMYGSSWTMGLTVYLLRGNVAQEIWRIRDNQGDSWHQALVDFTPQENFKIIFEGRRGHSSLSDVAVDDVSLHRGPCSVGQVTPSPPTKAPPASNTTTAVLQTTEVTTATPVQTTTAAITTTPEPAKTTLSSDQSPTSAATALPLTSTTSRPLETTEESSVLEPTTVATERPDTVKPTTIRTTTTYTESTTSLPNFSECSIDDDPEYKTFDDLKHEFKGKHSYILVQTANLEKNIPEVYIVGVNQKSRDVVDPDVVEVNDTGRDDDDYDDDSSEEEDDSSEEENEGRLRALIITVYNHTVEFGEGRSVMVDGVGTEVPYSPTTGLNILERSSQVYLKTDFGLSVKFNGRGKAEISMPHTYKGQVQGLCGNFDGKKKNDMMKPDGELAKNEKEFGKSWRVKK